MEQSKSLAFLNGGGETGAMMREIDWSNSPLGRATAWPQPLKTLVGVMLAAKQPMFLAWGPERTFLYNDPYVAVLGNKHPAAMGLSFHEVWCEIRDDLDPLVDQVFAGEPVHMDDITLMMDRHIRPAEAHFAFSYTPVRDQDGIVVGLFCPCTETTQQVLAERRQVFRLSLEEHLRQSDDPKAIIASTVQALGRYLKVNRVGYGLVSPDDASVVLQTSYVDGVKPLDGAFELAHFGADTIAEQRRGHTLVQSDLVARPFGNPAAWAEIETLALVSVPLVRDGRFKALLYVNQREPREWMPEDVALVEYVANRIWDASERAQAEVALRESEAHLAGIFAQTGAGFAETDLDGRFVSVNDHYCDARGPPPRGAAHAVDARHHLPGRPRIHVALFQRVVATGEPFTIEKRYMRAGGEIVWVANTVSLINSTGAKKTLLAVAIDISERRSGSSATWRRRRRRPRRPTSPRARSSPT